MSQVRIPMRVFAAVVTVFVALAVGAGAPAHAAGGSTKTVRYAGLALEVPASWPVVNLSQDSAQCVRLDKNAVYLGPMPRQQNCPARAIGRADTIWLKPSSGAAPNGTAGRVGALAATTARQPTSGQLEAAVPTHRVAVNAAWGGSSDAVDTALATLRNDSSTSVPTPAAAASGATPTPTATTSVPANGTPYVGSGMDTCAAPSLATMSAWRSSPYHVAGIYIGGSMRACGDGNLSASWISSVSAMGWGVIPIYVGLQAPCVQQGGLGHIDPANATAQGVAAGQDAIVMAKKFALPSSSPLYFDMEYYTGDATCTNAVLDFLSAWTSTLHAAGYRSGVYGNTNSVVQDMATAITNARPGFNAPDQIWYAQWDNLQTLNGSSYVPALKSTYWASHQRAKQWSGGATETWGGVTMNVDQNYIDSYLPGNATTTNYGTGATGPGGAGFLFTGPMNYWRPMAGTGVHGMAYWTYSSTAGREINGATWALPAASPGQYTVKVSIPSANANAKATYTVTDAAGPHTVVVDQSKIAGWTSLGTYLSTGTPITVHVGDVDAAGTASAKIGVDAASATLSLPPPAAPGSVSAVAGNAQATVRWPASAGTVSSYTVTAAPGGKTVTVPGTTTTATITGLTNHTAYTFTVKATNAGGTGPGRTSAPVVPEGPTSMIGLTPQRVLDTRSSGAIPAGGSVRAKVAGSGAIPATAVGVMAEVITPVPSAAGTLKITGVDPAGVAIPAVAGRTTDGLVQAPLVGGYLTITNTSATPQHVVIDVEAALVPGTTGAWRATSPMRVADTRVTKTSGINGTGRLAPHASRTFQVTGSTTGIPAGTTTAELTVLALAPTASGHLALAGGTSFMNFDAQALGSNSIMARLDANGRITITNNSGSWLNLVIDARGYAVAGSPNVVPAGGPSAGSATLSAWGTAKFAVRSLGLPGASGARSVLAQITATCPSTPTGIGADSGPTIGYAVTCVPGLVRSQVVAVPIASDGTISITNRGTSSLPVKIAVLGFVN